MKYIKIKILEIISKVIMENVPFFILLGTLSFFNTEDFVLTYGSLLKNILIPLILSYSAGNFIEKRLGGIAGVIVVGGILNLYQFKSFLMPILVGILVGEVVKYSKKILDKYKYPGYEMLINNILIVVLGTILIKLFSYIYPLYDFIYKIIVENINGFAINIKFYPLYSFIIEPAKVFFLNNLINHGVLSVIGLQELSEKGKSIFFLMETNPGPGLGILTAYLYMNKKNKIKKKNIISNIFIQFIGGIHEVYFPYVLKNLKLIIPLIISGSVGVYIFDKLNLGLLGVASPGSIIMILLLAPTYDKFGIFLGILTSFFISFIIGSIILKMSNKEEKNITKINIPEEVKNKKNIKIVVVCDAGMGSSTMGATLLDRKIKKEKLEEKISVENRSVDDDLNEFDIIVIHEKLVKRIEERSKNNYIVILNDFMDGKVYEELLKNIKNKIDLNKNNKEIVSNNITRKIIEKENLSIGLKKATKKEALEDIGKHLYELGYVEKKYINGILNREEISSTYLANGVAIPHGTKEYNKYIKNNGVVIHQYPYGIDYGDGKTVYILIGLAIKGETHIEILEKLSKIIENEDEIENLSITNKEKDFYKILSILED
ncbi:MAG: mannitol system or component [Fusobacteriaceae bacterium]|nr:mannitol system or component [Fusobacteriaceae bacterium]